MKKILKNISEKKNKILNNLSKDKNENTEFDLYAYALKEGQIIYIPDNFNFQKFIGKIDSFLKDKNKFKTGILTALIGEISIVGINDGHRETTDAEAIKVIIKFAKGITETLALVKDKDKIKELKEELKVYNSYLPVQMTEDDLVATIGLYLQIEQEPNIGKVMGHLKSNFAGQYDGKLASKIIRELLN